MKKLRFFLTTLCFSYRRFLKYAIFYEDPPNEYEVSKMHTQIEPKDWETWTIEQKNFISEWEGKVVDSKNYSGKKWEIGKARPEYGEICKTCSFQYCFYAEPRNWSLGDSDVWNLMKCANVNCGKQFESCL